MGEPEQSFSSACSRAEHASLLWATMCGSCAPPDQSLVLARAALRKNDLWVRTSDLILLFFMMGGEPLHDSLLSATIALASSLLAFFLLPETLSEQIREKARLQRVEQQPHDTQVNEGARSILRLIRLFAPLLLIDVGLIFIYPFVMPQYPFFFERVLKYSATQYGGIISMSGLALAVFPLLLGHVSNVFPKKPLIVLGSLLYAALNVGMLCLPQYPLLLVAAVVTGLGRALTAPALGATYLGATSENNRSQVMGIRSTALSLGVLCGPLSQALVSPWITPQTAFTVSIALSLAITLLALFALKSSQHEEEGNK